MDVPSKRPLGASLPFLCFAWFSVAVLAIFFSPPPLQDLRASTLLRFQSSHRIAPPTNTAVILYAYDETPINKINLLFFVEHGLHNNADFVFILNGPTTIEKMIPRADNIEILRRPKNACYGIGVYGQALKANQGHDYKFYKHFIMLSSEVRGPFVPHWSSACWSEAYLGKVTDEVKLVGMSFDCRISRHVQSMLWATDTIGMRLLLSSRTLGSCWTSEAESKNAELHATQRVLDAGYKVDVMLDAFHATEDYATTCEAGDPYFENAYYGINVHPFETMFYHPGRNLAPRPYELQTNWSDLMGYSSYAACSKPQ